MKSQVSTPVMVGIIAVIVLLIGGAYYFLTAHPFSGSDAPKPPMASPASGAKMELPTGNNSGAPTPGMGPGGGPTLPGAPGGGMTAPMAPGTPK